MIRRPSPDPPPRIDPRVDKIFPLTFCLNSMEWLTMIVPHRRERNAWRGEGELRMHSVPAGQIPRKQPHHYKTSHWVREELVLV
jgi:hypothetical protein